MKRRLGHVAGLLALIGSLVPAVASPPVVLPPPSPAPLHWDGAALRDASGREVTLRGLNVVFKRGGYLPDPSGSTITADSMNAADADLIASWGFNLVRLGLIWKAVEPVRGSYDDRYLARAQAIVRTLANRGIYTLIDFHQDVYNERYAGEGAPDWAVNSPLPPTNTGNWGANYFTPAVMNEYDLFWANANGVRDAYADAWMRVAAAFAGEAGVLGYDLFNEPWPGTQWPSCANPAGCPVFDDLILDQFYQQVLNAIRTIDPDRMIYFSPAIPTNFGAGTAVGPLIDGAGQTGLSFHVYCLEGSLDGSFSGQGGSCATLESRAMQTQADWARTIGAHPLLSEFGASDDLDDVERLIELAEASDANSYAYWAYKQFDDPTGSPTESVLDPVTLAPKLDKLRVIARPYAQSVAGTDIEQDWMPNEMLRTLRVIYDATGGETVIVWPREIQGPYGAFVVCDPPGGCSLETHGDRIIVHATAGAHVIVGVSRLD
ncbi:MAG TPA: cellulase family glycosylhydrolase [Actinomycetota bacterium]